METPTLPNGSILIYLEIDSISPNIWLCFFAQNILIFPESDLVVSSRRLQKHVFVICML